MSLKITVSMCTAEKETIAICVLMPEQTLKFKLLSREISEESVKGCKVGT